MVLDVQQERGLSLFRHSGVDAESGKLKPQQLESFLQGVARTDLFNDFESLR